MDRAVIACLTLLLLGPVGAKAQTLYTTIDNGVSNQVFTVDVQLPQAQQLSGGYPVGSFMTASTGLAVDDGGIYFASAHTISQYSLTGQLLGSASIGSDFNISALATYGDTLYATIGNGVSNQVFTVNPLLPQAQQLSGGYSVGSFMTPSTGLAVDADGLYFASAHTIWQYSLSGQLLGSASIGSDFDFNAIATYDGTLYATIGNGVSNQVFTVDPELPQAEQLSGGYSVGSFMTPSEGLAVDGDGIYFASAHTISQYSLTGQFLGSTSIGSDFDFNALAVHDVSSVASAVPETGTWAMVVLGLGMIGGLMRGQRTGRRAGI